MGPAQTATIIAPITGRGAVALFRISGPRVSEFLEKSVAQGAACLRRPRLAVLSNLIDYRDGGVFDEALVTYFKAPHSYTGEDVAELTIHGSLALSRQLMEVAGSLDIRPAEAGEFTKRAYLNGKIDLTQAEAVSDLIAAETIEQARVARQQLSGQLADAVGKVGEPLRNLLAEIEARIDFPEEGLEPEVLEQWVGAIAASIYQLREYIASYHTGRVLHDGAEVAIVGAPNAGKSSLLNRLVGEQRAIVTDIPGTTRDEIEERISISGVPVRLWDTAGIVTDVSRTLDPVEVLGIRRSRERMQHADLVILLFDAPVGLSPSLPLLEEVRLSGRPFLIVANKADLLGENMRAELERETQLLGLPGTQFVSALVGRGIERLLASISEKLVGDASFSTGALLITSRRHVEALGEAEQALLRAQETLLEQRKLLELTAIEVQHALGALDDIVGVTTTEDILGRIFSKFCIGK